MNRHKDLSEMLCAKGAILHLAQPDVHVPAGYWEWMDSDRIFYFAAGAEDEFGGHVLEFAQTVLPRRNVVNFRDERGELVARLSSIENAGRGDDTRLRHWSALSRIQELRGPISYRSNHTDRTCASAGSNFLSSFPFSVRKNGRYNAFPLKRDR